jgi:hypothetical protein
MFHFGIPCSMELQAVAAASTVGAACWKCWGTKIVCGLHRLVCRLHKSAHEHHQHGEQQRETECCHD